MNNIIEISLDHTFITVGIGATVFGTISGILGAFAFAPFNRIIINGMDIGAKSI